MFKATARHKIRANDKQMQLNKTSLPPCVHQKAHPQTELLKHKMQSYQLEKVMFKATANQYIHTDHK